MQILWAKLIENKKHSKTSQQKFIGWKIELCQHQPDEQ